MSETKRQQHPRHGHVVALFHGYATDSSDATGAVFITEEVLVEVHEAYNIWGQPESMTYHYDAWELSLEPKSIGIFTIGHIRFDPESKDAPPFIAAHVRDSDGQPFTWRRLR